MSEWIEWAGGECPADSETYVDVRFAHGGEISGPAGFWEWAHEFSEDNIIAYRVVKEKEA